MRGFTLLAPAALALGLGACDSIRGAQLPAATNQENLKAIDDFYDKGATVAERNRLITRRMTISNDRFASFTTELREAKIGVGFGGEVVTLILGAIGAVTGTAHTKSILLAVTGGVTGATAAYDKNVFYKQTITVLITQMTADRDAIKANLLKGMKLSIDEYPLAAALNQLQGLDQAGSIEMALSKVTEKAAKEAKEQSDAVAAVNVEITRTPADATYMISAAGRAQRLKVEKQVDQLAKTNPTRVVLFVLQPPVPNAKADTLVKALLSTRPNPTPSEMAELLKERVRASLDKAELDQWEKALN